MFDPSAGHTPLGWLCRLSEDMSLSPTHGRVSPGDTIPLRRPVHPIRPSPNPFKSHSALPDSLCLRMPGMMGTASGARSADGQLRPRDQLRQELLARDAENPVDIQAFVTAVQETHLRGRIVLKESPEWSDISGMY